MRVVVVERTYDAPVTTETLEEGSEVLEPCLQERNIRWRRSLLSGDRLRTLCEFDAPDAESVREAYRMAGIPFDQVWSAQVLE